MRYVNSCNYNQKHFVARIRAASSNVSVYLNQTSYYASFDLKLIGIRYLNWKSNAFDYDEIFELGQYDRDRLLLIMISMLAQRTWTRAGQNNSWWMRCQPLSRGNLKVKSWTKPHRIMLRTKKDYVLAKNKRAWIFLFLNSQRKKTRRNIVQNNIFVNNIEYYSAVMVFSVSEDDTITVLKC